MRLASAKEIESDAKVISIHRAGVELSLILVRTGDGELRCYLNECRHLPQRLDLLGERMIDRRAHDLVCSAHGARFRIQDGHCVAGPCKGSNLKRCAISEREGEVILDSTPLDTFLGFSDTC